MHPAIQTLTDHNIPTHSYVAAVKSLTEEDFSAATYRERITEMCGHKSDADDKTVRWHYLYLVQETVRKSLSTDKLDMDQLFEAANDKAIAHLKKNPWLLTEVESAPKLDAAGNPKKKKGAKKEMAIALYQKMVDENKGKFPSRKDAIDRFVEEIGMTPAGASTYVANCKKNFAKGSW